MTMSLSCGGPWSRNAWRARIHDGGVAGGKTLVSGGGMDEICEETSLTQRVRPTTPLAARHTETRYGPLANITATACAQRASHGTSWPARSLRVWWADAKLTEGARRARPAEAPPRLGHRSQQEASPPAAHARARACDSLRTQTSQEGSADESHPPLSGATIASGLSPTPGNKHRPSKCAQRACDPRTRRPLATEDPCMALGGEG